MFSRERKIISGGSSADCPRSKHGVDCRLNREKCTLFAMKRKVDQGIVAAEGVQFGRGELLGIAILKNRERGSRKGHDGALYAKECALQSEQCP